MTGEERQRRGRARETKLAERRRRDGGGPAPVAPGLVGGRYLPLSDRDLARIHGAALEVLERVGMADATPALRDLALARGARVNEKDRLCFPRSLVEDTVAGAAHGLTLHARNPDKDLEVSGRRVHFGTGGAAVKVLDPADGRYRDASLTDLYDFARLVDRLDNVHWFTRCVIATEISDSLELDLNTAYACLAGTDKHLGTAITEAGNVAPVIALFDKALGGEGAFARRPICKLHSSPIVPPLRYGAEACDTIFEAVRHGMPINAITAGQSGATAPAALAGTLVQTVAETLAALLLVNLIRPGHPFIFSNWPMVSDLRTGAFSGGGGEEAILNAAAAQIANFYDLPSGVAAGMADSKIPDEQAGYEKALTTALAGLAGANLVYESSGMLASLLGCSFESFVLDDEMLGFVLRAVRGIEVTEETLAVETIAEAAAGPGHFLGSSQTLALMEKEYVYPRLGDRSTPEDWQQRGGSDIRARALARVREILAEHYPAHIDPALDEEIRARFPIRLPEAAMSPEGSHW